MIELPQLRIQPLTIASGGLGKVLSWQAYVHRIAQMGVKLGKGSLRTAAFDLRWLVANQIFPNSKVLWLWPDGQEFQAPPLSFSGIGCLQENGLQRAQFMARMYMAELETVERLTGTKVSMPDGDSLVNLAYKVYETLKAYGIEPVVSINLMQRTDDDPGRDFVHLDGYGGTFTLPESINDPLDAFLWAAIKAVYGQKFSTFGSNPEIEILMEMVSGEIDPDVIPDHVCRDLSDGLGMSGDEMREWLVGLCCEVESGERFWPRDIPKIDDAFKAALDVRPELRQRLNVIKKAVGFIIERGRDLDNLYAFRHEPEIGEYLAEEYGATPYPALLDVFGGGLKASVLQDILNCYQCFEAPCGWVDYLEEVNPETLGQYVASNWMLVHELAEIRKVKEDICLIR